MNWLNPYRWLLVGGLIAALLLGYVTWAGHQQAIGYDKAQAEYTAVALAASEAARKKEAELQTKVTKVANELKAEKTKRAADAVIAAGKLRDFETALDRAAGADTGATARADDPAVAVARQCARSIVLLDEYAQGLAGQVRGLQDYTKSVRVMP